jgi:hypothetical protein
VASAAFVAVTAFASRAGATECASTPMPADPPGVKTHARIEKVGARYRATLDIETTRSRGERVVEAESCEALARSTAVVVAMAVAPERDAERDKVSEEPTKEEPRPAAPPPPPPPVAEERKPERDAAPRSATESTPVTVRVEAAADSALLPSLAIGGGIALGVRATEKLRFEARAAMFARQEERAFEDRGATFSLASGGARTCYALTRDVELAPCLGIDVSAVGASGFGAARVGDGTAWIVSPEALLALRVRLGGPISVVAAAGVLAPLSRETFVITGRGTVHEVPAVLARGFLGPEVHF